MTDSSSASNFDNYIVELHENLDRLRDISDVDEQSSTIIADLAQAYSEHPSPMQTAMCLSALFCGQKNILTFLRRSCSKTELKKTKVEILQFLKFFVESAGVKILPHAVELKTVLLTIFNVDNASDVRASIFPVLSQLMELSAGSSDMQNEVDKMATTFLDQIGLQSSKAAATIKGLCLAFLGLLCKFFPEHMRKYSDPLLLGQYLKYLHEQIDEEFLCPLERLTVMTIDYYPRYQPKPLAKIYSFVIKKILGLQTKPNVYKPFLTEIVTQVLIRCCSHQFKIFYLRIIRKFSTR
ncbi:unnamed protein product [Rotaria sp. Silwood2]|nr:unnamed protein product [Rotaria sp. Silwood2]